jgi:vancomycin resistance protein YoaR
MVRSVGLAASLAVALLLGVAAARAVAEQSLPPPPIQPAPAPRPRDPELKPPAADELIARFTTRYEPGQPRVTNIRRAAELLDGTALPPGGVFSLNAALGERTTARGFVQAPMISGGRLIDSVGGGISQVATALYNAAFFAGLDLVEHTPHSFFIDRYPMGREATVSWGGPELIFRNDWHAPLRMRLQATGTGLTVRFYSARLGRSVETTTGEPYDFTQPSTVVVMNPALAAGAEVVVQEAGGPGFTVEYTRRVYQDGKLIRHERFRTEYEPKNAIIEVGPRLLGRP